jgi:formiminoglutamase
MSGASSSAADWSTLLEPVGPYSSGRGPDDPRLGDIAEFWRGDEAALRPGRVAIVGFPQDEGVRRNGGRVGAAEAPAAIRQQLYRLTPWDPRSDVEFGSVAPIDLGNLRIQGDLEESQQALGEVVGKLLQQGLVPVILGGGHETGYGTYLGHVQAGRPLGIINFDAHLDVRSFESGRGHSGSPYRQALEHPSGLLRRYVCMGAQPFSVSREHARYVLERGGSIIWRDQANGMLLDQLYQELKGPAWKELTTHVSLDADVVRVADVPGVSANNPTGLDGDDVLACVATAGQSLKVTSFELVEINPRFDRDGQSARWAAVAVWRFLVGRAQLSMVCQ